MRKQTVLIAIAMLVISSWNSFAFSQNAFAPELEQNEGSTSQTMMMDHCDQAHEDSNSDDMSCLKHCAAIFALPSYSPFGIESFAEAMGTSLPSFKLIPELFNHWRPPSLFS